MSTPLRAESSAEQMAVGFARLLRKLDIPTPLDAVLTFVDALGLVGLRDRGAVYWAARATLVRRPEDIGTFDRAFAVFWEHLESPEAVDPEEISVTLAIDDGAEGVDDGESAAGHDPTITLRFSGVETLGDKDFADYTDEEMRLAQRFMETLRVAGAPRPSLRRTTSNSRTGRPDMRRTVRASLAAGGEHVRRRFTEPGTRPRRIVFLLDVSGSMEPYARALVRFVHAGVAGRERVEAFTMGTRLTRVTRELSSKDPDRALHLAGHRVRDWSGGTRLGETLRAFNDEWGVRGMARSSIVVILSDGWDRGDPGLLSEQMERLTRVAWRIVWVNPLKVTPGYAPLARGMAAALPYVDDFVEGHSLEALQTLTRVINSTGDRRTETDRSN
ncbi:MAG: VWA domain-containing protein [Actinobacteria bacterium]|nr:VWA domain-containing protein [Actinomycetota bacterium]